MTGPARQEPRTTFTSTTGGVMTEEAGAITGELEVSCRPAANRLHVLVRYAGTDEWYTVSGGPIPTQDDPDEASEEIVRHLRTPGPVVDGNEKAVTLEGFAGA